MTKRNLNPKNTLFCGDSKLILRQIQEETVDLALTSPPYFGCREYDEGDDGLGREEDPREYIENVADIVDELRPVLKNTGSLYLNIGDVYFGTKGFSRNAGKWARKTDHSYRDHSIIEEDGAYLQHKQRLMLPERIAINLQERGWILRNSIIWEKPNALPCHAPDRRLPVYEHIFHFVKSKKYYFDYKLAKQLGHHRDVIRCTVEPYKDDHLATFSARLIHPFIATTSPVNGVVMDFFAGTGTTLVEARRQGRKVSGIEKSRLYCDIIIDNLKKEEENLSTLLDSLDGEDVNKECIRLEIPK